MAQWYSPFKLPEEASRIFRKSGWSPWKEKSPVPDDPTELILCYLPPHKLIDEVENITLGYSKLKQLAPNGSLLHLERLSIYSNAHSDELPFDNISKFFDFLKSLDHMQLPKPDPISALITLHLVGEKTEVLDAYLDLELIANLHGLSSDSNYFDRLRDHCSLDRIIAYHQTAREQKSSLEMHLEQSKAKLELLEQEITKLRESERASEQERLSMSQQLQRAMEELESGFLELQEEKQQKKLAVEDRQQIQEGREKCLADFKESKDLISAQSAQIKRAFILLKQLAEMKGLRGYQHQQNSIQVMALLEAYRHSLKRAERLLTSGSAR